MLAIYKVFTHLAKFAFVLVLKRRLKKGKEHKDRYPERMAETKKERPKGSLIWCHAASVGEAQSTLIIIKTLLKQYPKLNILVTTGTLTSAKAMAKQLPKQAFHQFYPLDRPDWTKKFLDHWQPDGIIWMESELWPNMLLEIKRRDIPAALVNARLSDRSFKSWKRAKGSIARLLSTFTVCLAQSENDAQRFKKLRHPNVSVAQNLKYAADQLPCDKDELKRVSDAIKTRPIWVAASTHQGEEDIACRIHLHLKQKHPDILTIIVPRHPERRDSIKALSEKYKLKMQFRSSNKRLPAKDDDIYVADTIGELGLFYRLASIAFIGRSLSADGGGGHNPIEAAQLGCAILHGPYIQNFTKVYGDFVEAGASLEVDNEQKLQNKIEKLLADDEGLNALQNKALTFVAEKAKVLDHIMNEISPITTIIDKNLPENKAA